MACEKCPYKDNYTLLWQDGSRIAVLLRCCAGPELQVREGSTVVLSELYSTVAAVERRAAELRIDTTHESCDN